jgi:hypothetical protein
VSKSVFVRICCLNRDFHKIFRIALIHLENLSNLLKIKVQTMGRRLRLPGDKNLPAKGSETSAEVSEFPEMAAETLVGVVERSATGRDATRHVSTVNQRLLNMNFSPCF